MRLFISYRAIFRSTALKWQHRAKTSKKHCVSPLICSVLTRPPLTGMTRAPLFISTLSPVRYMPGRS
jgi:hypothetical protein